MREAFGYNIILLGGTGAKCGEILLHMCANGYFRYRYLNILYIDSDTDNGNARRFRELYETYMECRARYVIKSSPISCFFYPEIRLMTKNPVGKLNVFSDMINESGSDHESSEGARALMGALYSKEEIDLRISDGFFAHPNVGAAVFAANMDEIMSDFSSLIQAELQEAKKVKIFVLGSVFGGTGAASLPTIAKYIREKLIGASDNRNIKKLMKIGACMVLPYFLFEIDDKISAHVSQEPTIEANKFAMKTKAALEYYKYVEEESGQKIVDEMFILGHDGADVRGRYAAAGEKQRNLPHIVELYAAMSAVTFFEAEMEKRGTYFAVVPADKTGGESIYGGEIGYSLFFIMMRFSIVMESLIIDELFDHTHKDKLNKKAKKIPWYYDFLNGKAAAKDFVPTRLIEYFKDIRRYCDEYIRWFAELSLKNIDKQNLLNQVNYDEEKEDGDIVKYVDFFSKELLFRQYQNIQIRNGDMEVGKETARNLYDMNRKYIRRNLQHLEEIHFSTDKDSERIDMDRIWSRLSGMGFSHFVKDKDIFRNIVQSEDKSMEAGVRNLVNAVFCACLF